MELPSDGPRLRERFLDEARMVSRLTVDGILPVRDAFSENGTAYFATEYLPNSESLDKLLLREGRMSADGALDLFFQLLETLDAVHGKSVLHRDIKPSNILVNPSGHAYLIDFGSAREWHADAENTQTVMFTPGYAAPEQLSEKGRRGPATDIYALCATLYHMLVGRTPVSATDRIAGIPLLPLSDLRPDVEAAVARAVARGLALNYSERPQSVQELRDALQEMEEESAERSLLKLDELLAQVRAFRFEKRACPSCNGLLEESRPLRKGFCPMCHQAPIRKREILDRLCPVCTAGALSPLDNRGPLAICPICAKGRLETRRKTLLSRQLFSHCPTCDATFDHADGGMTDRDGTFLPYRRWQEQSGRSARIWACDGCGAQLDEQSDGRLVQVLPKPKGPYRALYPDEWARVASGLSPSAGNAYCDGCGSDFYLDQETLTLLSFIEDPHGYASAYEGRRISLESVPWLAVGKDSPRPGLVCDGCDIEFDREGEFLRLVRSTDRRFTQWIDALKKLEDWHRIGRGLPEIADEEDFAARLDEVLEDAYLLGEIGFEGNPSLLYKGPAVRDEATGVLSINETEIVHGGLLRKLRIPIEVVVDAFGEGDILRLRISGRREETTFKIEPVELVAHLKSGDRALCVDAALLSKRIRGR